MRTYIIAEIGPNHNGSYEIAIKMVKELAKIGVDAVKFQLSNPEKVLSLDSFKADYQKINDNDEDIFKASKKRQLTLFEHKKLSDYCKQLGIDYLCTAFDLDSLIFLDQEIDIPKFKIASGEIFSLDMLQYISHKNKPIILSTGMATFKEITKVYDILNQNKKHDITILHCVTSYPTPIEKVNLNIMLELQKKFRTKVGYSDHTLGNTTALASVAIGATIIEKHVTLDKSLPGPDHKASATIKEFADLIKDVRNIELAFGNSNKRFSSTELDIAKVARKSIVSKRNISKGSFITDDDICYRRPGTGFLPIDRDLVIGKKAITDIEENRVIRKEQIQ